MFPVSWKPDLVYYAICVAYSCSIPHCMLSALFLKYDASSNMYDGESRLSRLVTPLFTTSFQVQSLTIRSGDLTWVTNKATTLFLKRSIMVSLVEIKNCSFLQANGRHVFDL